MFAASGSLTPGRNLDSLIFILALCVGVAVIAWYFLNEAKGSDGALGALALRSDGAASDLKENAAEAGRYRIRTRLTPERRAGLHAAAPRQTYRVKIAERPSSRGPDPDAADDY